MFNIEATSSKSLDFHFYKDEVWDYEAIFNETTKLVNRLIDIYKSVNDSTKDWIPFVTKGRLSPLKIRCFDKDNIVFHEYNSDFRGTGILIGNELTVEQLIELKRVALMWN